MAEVLLFHHAQGLTAGVAALADELRAAGHVVHTPDLYGGRTFPDLDSGVAHAREIGFEEVVERGRRVAEGLPDRLVYIGMSLGAMPAQAMAQNRPGAAGLLLLHGCAPVSEFGRWPDGLQAQIHTMSEDDWGDVEVAQDLAANVPGIELFLYPGDAHLFTDRSLDAYDAAAAAQVHERVLAYLSHRN